MRAGLLLATTILIGVPVPGSAQTAEPAAAGTPEGARELAGDLALFTSRAAIDKGIIAVTPDPAGYRITIDLAPVLSGFADNGASFTFSPYGVVVSRRSDGNWNVFTDDPIKFSTRLSLNGIQQSADYEYGPQVFKGVYAPSLAAFQSGSGTIGSLKANVTDPFSHTSAEFGEMTFEVSGSPAGEGATNVSTKQTLSRFSESVTYKLGEAGLGAGDVPVTVTASDIAITASATAARMKAILDVYAFLLANSDALFSGGDKAPLAAKQDALRSKARALLPLWNNIAASYGLSDMAVSTPVGRFAMKRVTQEFSLDGLSPSGTMRYAFGLEGLTADLPAAPPWAVPLIPHTFGLGVRVEDLDLKTPADILLADFDLTAAEPLSPAATAEIEASFARHPPRIVIEPSRIEGAAYAVDMSGDIRFPDNKPELKLDIVAKGLDSLIASLQSAAANAPDLYQLVGGLQMAKGFGKPLADGRTQWLLAVAGDGSLTLNGTQLKGPDLPKADVPAEPAPVE